MRFEKVVYGREVFLSVGECGLQVPAVEFLEGDTGVGGQDSYCLGRVCDESVHDAAPYQGFVSRVLPQMFSGVEHPDIVPEQIQSGPDTQPLSHIACKVEILQYFYFIVNTIIIFAIKCNGNERNNVEKSFCGRQICIGRIFLRP